MANTIMDIFYSLGSCIYCFPSTPQLKINSRSFRMLRLLGEGGFSYVYLVQDTADSALYALKKIRCPFGQESVSQALKEVEAYTLFAPHPNIIHSIDHAVQNDSTTKVSGIGNDGGSSSKTVYILLPYYRRGNLQDMINANLVNHTRFGERRLMQLMLGVCKALKAMHQYRVRNTPSNAAAKAIRDEAADEDADTARRHARMQNRTMTADQTHQEELNEEQEAPLMPEAEITRAQEGKQPGEDRAYAHRDIKPGNIMLDDDGRTPILMDLGSLAPSPTPITSRSFAIAVQDTAAEHSTMPYRAPELFDVKTGSVIDTKVDIWPLGCTMYACLIGKSPFEARSDETGGSLSICVLGGDWRWPGEGNATKGKDKMPPSRSNTQSSANGDLNNTTPAASGERTYPHPAAREVVRRCLAVEPSERPDVDELMTLIDTCLSELPEDDEGGPIEGDGEL
ncbi:Serine/threonine-protein kinase env7 [Elasticomyces elasticus]|uniref:non-specific serine/threonine protein kinase n=1 Tax=Exophiala sideris TaxID=1016849 RepID=A0ABR0J1Q9_9EURO|nr:Serine/threonine-protein kinase env7 [Elasticomyces elasticus]KAK5024452.1 Serine/threonine-protein kinase env7 [Exophiala sideris]KAK5030866.1 Serine/threonine-protein kinase env7 [Exophiala sideris]KAK5054185.1 Serine/threonine-protein kinase env7 [Exophiala sideris]KAK5179459.1 Serine/threonine-protein kinase env7 [Eurotiomycetes sp. CCFEE 6388]